MKHCMYEMDGLAFFLIFLSSVLIFILLCSCSIRLCVNRFDPSNRLDRAYRTDFTGV